MTNRLPIPLDDDERICGHCRRIVHIEDCDTCGAGPCGMFCPWCNGVIDVVSGAAIDESELTKKGTTIAAIERDHVNDTIDALLMLRAGHGHAEVADFLLQRLAGNPVYDDSWALFCWGLAWNAFASGPRR